MQEPFLFEKVMGNVVVLKNSSITLKIPMHPSDVAEFTQKHVVGSYVYIYSPTKESMN